MSDQVQGLIIEIESDVSQASSNLNKLIENLETLRDRMKVSTSIGTFTKNYNNMLAALNRSSLIDNGKTEAIRSFTTALENLSNMKVDNSVSKHLTKLTSAVDGMSGEAIGRLNSFSNMLEKIAGLSNIKISTTIITKLRKIADFADELKVKDFSKLDQLTTSLSRLRGVADSNSKSLSDLTSSLSRYANMTQRASSRGRTFNTVLANIKVTTLAVIHGFQKTVDVVHDMIGTYGDYIETLNLFEVSMEDSGEAMYAYAKKAQDLLGIDMTQWMKGQGVFMSLGKGFGIATDRASLMSQQLTQLAYDISSFYNIDVSSAIEKVQSGFAGQLKPLRTLGFDLSQAKLEAIALSLGIDKSVKSMTQAEKAQLRYMAMLTQVKDVQGDLARTINSPINQLRILQAQLQQMFRSFGLLFLPILNEIIPYLMAILKVIRWIADEIAKLFGYTLPSIDGGKGFGLGIEEDTETMADGFEDATAKANELKNTLASFDQINLITSSSGGGAGAGIGAGIDGSEWNFDLPTYDFFGDAAQSKADEIAKTIEEKITPALETIKDIIEWIRNHTDVIKSILLGIAGATVAGSLISKFSELKKTFGSIEDIAGGIKTALGIGFVIGGVTLSYAGGKSFGSGDLTEGILKWVFGAGLAAIGGAIAFGSAGAVISVGLSFAFFLYGVSAAESEAIKERVDEIFASVNDGKITVDECKKSWEEFTASLSMGEVDTTGVEQAQQEIEFTSKAIQQLQIDYAMGLVTTEGFTANMLALFDSLKTGVEKKLNEMREVINTALTGPLGVLMLKAGYTQEEIDRLMGLTVESVNETFDEAKIQVENLNTALQNGTITYEGYQYALGLVSDKLSKYGIDLTGSSEAMDNFNKKWTEGIDINNFAEGVQLVKDINADYNETMKSLTADRDKLQNAFQVMLDSAKTEEERRAYETGLEMVNTLYDMNTKALGESYLSVMETIENSSFKSWAEVLDKEGFDTAYHTESEGLLELYHTIKEKMPEGLSISANAFSDTAKALEGYNKALDDANKGSGDIEEIVKTINYDYWKEYISGISEATKQGKWYHKDFYDEVSSRAEEFRDGIKSKLGKNIKDLSDWGTQTEKTTKGISGSFGNVYGLAMKVPKEISDACMKSTIAMMQQKGNFLKAGNGLVDQVGIAFGDPNGTLAKKLNGTIGGASSTIGSETNANKFKAAGDKIFGKLKEAFSDPEGKLKANVQNMVDKVKEINGAEYSKKGGELRDKILNPLNKDNPDTKSKVGTTMSGLKELMENKLKLGDLGEKEGNAFFDDLTDSLTDSINISELQKALDTVTNTMRGAFASMGVDVLTYMTKFMGKIAEIWNNLEITAGTAKYKGDANVPPKIDMRYLAKGGFVPSGDLFVANENGVAEYVGSMGGKAAVANNEQIIKGVSDGVLRALKETGIAGDVKTIAKKSNKVVFAPSEEAGRVMHQSMNMYNPTGGRYS